MHRLRLPILALLLVFPLRVEGTWSVIIVNPTTREVAVGSVTCLNNFDLRAITPVVLVGLGGATVQAAGDFNGIRRPIIFDGFLEGVDPVDMMVTLAGIAGHAQRQYGIVDTLGRAVTFTGGQTASWAGGVTGETGDLVYALQGNILAGACVVPAMEEAILVTPGDIPAKLMAAMEAARVTGGDGRCSCSPGNPTGCGCPPSTFAKSGHIGYMITARIGDTDDLLCNASGCADGDYFMNFNIPFQATQNPDPVIQLQIAFDVWRAELAGRPDAIQSTASFETSVTGLELVVQLNDWQELPVATGTVTLTVEHEPDSAGAALIGTPVEVGAGLFAIPLTPGSGAAGIDRFRITAVDGFRDVVLMPSPELCVGDVAGGASLDCNGNGLADECEIFDGLVADSNENGIPDTCEQFTRGDCNTDGETGLADVIGALGFLFGSQGPVVCEKACDTNDDGVLNIVDPVALAGHLFQMEPAPPAPYPDCGFDGTVDNLSCTPFTPCL